jgi:Predicted Fe-S-cluster oxidoreductase
MPLTEEEADSGIYDSHVDKALNAKVLNRQENGHCTYLQDERCTIYSHRPQACRLFDCRVYQVLPLEWFAHITPAVQALKENAAQRFELVTKEPSDATFHVRMKQAAEVVSQRTHSTISASAVLHQMQP